MLGFDVGGALGSLEDSAGGCSFPMDRLENDRKDRKLIDAFSPGILGWPKQ